MGDYQRIYTGGDLQLAGMLRGLNDMGATYVKHQHDQVFFDVKRGSEIDTPEMLTRANNLFKEMYGVTMRVKRID